MPIIQEPPRPTPGPTPTIPHPARHAESADARMGIRHDEEKQERKKDDDHDHHLTLPEDVYDQTTLGVQALIDFLKKFLQSLEATSTAKQILATTKSPKGPEEVESPSPSTPPVNPVAAAAAHAYAHTAHTHTDLSGSTHTDTTPAPALLQAAEIRQIHDLLGKLNRLNDLNIVGLKLNKAETFVQSLMNAANQALAAAQPPQS